MNNTVQQVIAMHAVDNIKLSEETIKLLYAIQRGEITSEQAKKLIARKAVFLKNAKDLTL
jgi:polyhydroxyalkanoate synthesis regulator phasin